MLNYKYIIIVLVCIILTPAHAESCLQQDKQLLNSIVRITGDETIASGVIIGKNRIITAAHVIDELDIVYAEINSVIHQASVLMVYPEKDIAVLAVDTGTARYVPIASDSLSLNSTYWAVGYPLGGNQVANPGRFSQYTDGNIHTTASVNFGQSGGGLFLCENGALSLAGMVTGFGAIDHGDYYERLDNHSIAVSISEVAWLINASKNTAEIASVSNY